MDNSLKARLKESPPSDEKLRTAQKAFLSLPVREVTPTGILNRPHVELREYKDFPSKGRHAVQGSAMILEAQFIAFCTFVGEGRRTVQTIARDIAYELYTHDCTSGTPAAPFRATSISCRLEPLAIALRSVLPPEMKVVWLCRNAKVKMADGLSSAKKATFDKKQTLIATIVSGIMGDDVVKACSSPNCPQNGRLVCKPALNACTGCKSTSYCDKNCQKADWKRHKVMCKDAAQHTEIVIEATA